MSFLPVKSINAVTVSATCAPVKSREGTDGHWKTRAYLFEAEGAKARRSANENDERNKEEAYLARRQGPQVPRRQEKARGVYAEVLLKRETAVAASEAGAPWSR
ncbi:hypothetical protein FCM35_KLT10800 [Carex littledalei]|uniref:Uncharacterized protein n=1 Tax=Carex littledalei TaxID=544730 RepID=A0A833VIX4_9POAL|nr:hypothetical protein FCM35_KLT10800 [Carex littledalei]